MCAMTLLASQRHGGIALTAGPLEWNDTGSLGRTGRGDKEGMLCSMSVTSSDCLGTDEKLTKRH